MTWKLDLECRANTFRALDSNVSSVFLNDLVHDGQAQAGTLVEGARVFGSKEWVENVVKVLRRDSQPSIFNFDVRPFLPVRLLEPMGSHADRTGILADGIHRIQKEVENDLFNLLPI